MRRPPSPITLALLALAALALLAPASSSASEAAPGTPTTPSSPLAVPAPSTEAAPAPAAGQTTEPAPASGEPVAPQVQAQLPQGSSPGGSSKPARARRRSAAAPGAAAPGAASPTAKAGAPRAPRPAPLPSALTPSLPLSLRSSFGGLPSFFIESFQVPPFLLPIFQAAGTAYGIPWQVLAAINEVETDYGRDLSVSSAGAEGWMQFLPAEWAQYGVDANGDGFKDPYNPADAIFAAARYLRAAGGESNIRTAVYSYNHSQAYVESVMLRAQLLGGTPPELLGAITGLTEARFPVHAASHFTDGFPTLPASSSAPARSLVGATIYSQAGAPVIAVQDGAIVQIGESQSLGRFVALRDAFGNTYIYSELGDLAPVYPVLQPRLHSAVSSRIASRGAAAEPAPSGPATAGAQPRSPISEAGIVSSLALGAAAGLESAPAPPAPSTPRPVATTSGGAIVRAFVSGSHEVYLHPLRAGVEVIAGTILGHVGAGTASGGEPHILFQIRPAGAGAPLIDPKPILDGWVALENTSIFRARGENPFLATSPTVGQVLLESKQQLEPQVLHDAGIRLGACGRQDIQSGRVQKRVLAMLEYLSVSGLRPTVAGLACSPSTPAALAANVPAGAGRDSLYITAVNGIPIAGHQGPGSIAESTVRRLLMLQGLSRPSRIISLISFPGVSAALARPSAAEHIYVSFGSPGGARARSAGLLGVALAPNEWTRLIARLGEIPDPRVSAAPSPSAIAVAPGEGRQANGNG